MIVVENVSEMKGISENVRKEKVIGFVPTMGYLHEGHLSLVRKSKEMTDFTVVSIFVNPTQFGPNEDYERYPRDIERDRALLEKEGVDVLFCPKVEDIYPKGYKTFVRVVEMEDYLCGRVRKGHFQGVVTIVNKLFNIVKPHFAFFGMKDYQQLKIIETMVRDLNMDVKIIPCPTVREKDGLAMSSRNTYLTASEREKAVNIYKALLTGKGLYDNGERDSGRIIKEMKEFLSKVEGLEVEYVSVVHPETLEDVGRIEGSAVIAIAARIGTTRLIDNMILTEGGEK